jgi:hypothetical protein
LLKFLTIYPFLHYMRCLAILSNQCCDLIFILMVNNMMYQISKFQIFHFF